ncbi:MAG: B12-binding domain-containing radical SAM protein [Candidatus Hodarchaeota archaeon]
MKVLLVYPPFQVGSGMSQVMRSPPLSLLQLAAVIPAHHVEILDLNVNPHMSIADIEKKISKFDLVGITCMTNMLKVTLNLCKIAKKYNVTTVVGGFHPTLNPDMIKEPNVDYIVRGEGEFTFKELVNGLDPREIMGLSYKENNGNNGNNGGFHHNEPRAFIQNLDILPYPRKDLVNYSPYHYLWVPADVVETSRGCPFDCSFCCVTKFYCRTWRKKSPIRVIKELMLVPRTQKLVFFVDDNFTLDHKRVKRICHLIRQYGINKRLFFVCQTRVDDIAKDPEMVREMARSGFICFFIGFESFKQMSLNNMNKKISLKQAKKAVEVCHKNGIMVFGSFIVGNIGETREDTLKTFKLMKELKIDFMMTNPLTPFPGTQLGDDAVKNGWIDKDFDWKNWQFRAIINTPDLSADEIQDLCEYSLKYFYKDLKYFLFGKSSLKMYKSPLFIRILPGFLLKGLKNFLIKV